MLLTVENERLSHLIKALAHKGFLNLVLNILNGDVVVHIQMVQNSGNCSQVSRFLYTLECLHDGIHNLVKRKLIF